MDSKVLELEPKINSLISEVENDFSPDRLMKIKKRLDDYVKDIDLYFASIFRINHFILFYF